MIRHIFFDKTATIVKGSKCNTGMNPIVELNCCGEVSRILLHFDENEIKELQDDKYIVNTDDLSCSINLTNCSFVNSEPYSKVLNNFPEYKERASSFSVLALKLPKAFDGGKGFDFIKDASSQNKSYVESGCNWYFAKNTQAWDDAGVFSLEKIQEEYEKFKNNEDSLVMGVQYFDFGNEHLQIDITTFIKALLTGETNNGILLCFNPELECGYIYMATDITPETYTTMTEVPTIPTASSPKYIKVNNTFYCLESLFNEQQYIGFFSKNTNTFFHPYLELNYKNYVDDNRENFCIGKENKLYLYAYEDNKLENLDVLPKCTINNTEYTVEQVSKGIYCAKVTLTDIEPNTICYDVWSDLKYNNVELDDVEMEFVTHPISDRVSIGNSVQGIEHLVPYIHGINDDEVLSQGEVREVFVDFRKKYTTNEKLIASRAFYRLYSKNENTTIDIFNDYQPVEHQCLSNNFIINTNDLVPGIYYVDIKVLDGRETRYFNDILHFTIGNNKKGLC